MSTTTTDPQTVRRRAVDWLLDVIDQEMLADIGEVATPLDDLTPAGERRAVEWLRARVVRLDNDQQDEIERLRVLANANRQRGEEIANLRVIAEHYSMEPCQYVEEGRCSDPAQSLALEEFCGPCSARHVLSDPA